MRLRASLSFILLTITIISCGPTENEFRDNFRWISGKWSGTVEGIQIVEHWVWNKHRYEGAGYHLSGEDTIFKESLFLEKYASKTAYSVVFGDNGPYTFGLKHNDGQVFVFQNPEHDFPSEVIYRLDSDSAITITLIGNGDPVKEEQSYQLLRSK